MRIRKSGLQHPLLFYRRTIDRIISRSFFLGMLLIATWGWLQFKPNPALGPEIEFLFLGGGGILLTLGLFALISRFFAYIQVHRTYLSVCTPFLRFKISFQRLRSVHPALIQQLFPKNESKWAQRKFLEPFYGKTAVVVELSEYPLNPMLLKVFLPSPMFYPHSTGFVILVPDWMKFSTELDSFLGAWLQTRRRGIKTSTR